MTKDNILSMDKETVTPIFLIMAQYSVLTILRFIHTIISVQKIILQEKYESNLILMQFIDLQAPGDQIKKETGLL